MDRCRCSTHGHGNWLSSGRTISIALRLRGLRLEAGPDNAQPGATGRDTRTPLSTRPVFFHALAGPVAAPLSAPLPEHFRLLEPLSPGASRAVSLHATHRSPRGRRIHLLLPRRDARPRGERPPRALCARGVVSVRVERAWRGAVTCGVKCAPPCELGARSCHGHFVRGEKLGANGNGVTVAEA